MQDIAQLINLNPAKTARIMDFARSPETSESASAGAQGYVELKQQPTALQSKAN
jgi:hypothetical protein